MPQSLALRVFLPFALGYFASSIFRSINGVIAPDLVRDLGLNATELGFIGSTYFVGAMLLQIPLGILVDRYGPRIVYVICLVLGAAGSAIFGLADGVAGLAVGRFLTAIAAAASAACA
ncbi:MAG: MFS transporter, partial [Rhodospirillaceae bacterium]|nr:MFS transporter [Rhodospirillaceae bacterium]